MREARDGANYVSIGWQAVNEIRQMAWGFDIPSPCCPEYQELHEKMQEIMNLCDAWLMNLEDKPKKKAEKPIFIRGECYTQDADKQGWTGKDAEPDTWEVVNRGAPNGLIELKHGKCGNNVICPKCDIPTFCARCGNEMKWEEGDGKMSMIDGAYFDGKLCGFDDRNLGAHKGMKNSAKKQHKKMTIEKAIEIAKDVKAEMADARDDMAVEALDLVIREAEKMKEVDGILHRHCKACMEKHIEGGGEAE